MPRFFVSHEDIVGSLITVRGDDALHISRSLRLKKGERVTVCDPDSTEYLCEAVEFYKDHVEFRVLSSQNCASEPPYDAVLCQALPKGDKMDLIVQKAVETGVSGIIPFISEYCISRPDLKTSANKLERWNRIALEAAKQCGRGKVPRVAPICTFGELFERLSGDSIILYENEDRRSLKQALRDISSSNGGTVSERLNIAVGSEGGFSDSEIEYARTHGMLSAGLGSRILRCETASIAALAMLSYEFEQE